MFSSMEPTKKNMTGVWACEKFIEYVVGMSFVLETDHKPLQALFKPLSRPRPHHVSSGFAFG